MLDTRYLIHTNLELKTEEEAVDYILEQVKVYVKLASYIRGIHLNPLRCRESRRLCML